MPTRVDPDAAKALFATLRRGGAVIESEVRGPSMGATLPDGAQIRIHCGAGQAPGAGEVVAFLGRRGLVVHRVVGRGVSRRAAEHLVTRGDAQPLWDPPIRTATVLGVVTHWRPMDGAPWVSVAPAPPGRVRATADRLATLLLDAHPNAALGLIASLIWLRRLGQRLRLLPG